MTRDVNWVLAIDIRRPPLRAPWLPALNCCSGPIEPRNSSSERRRRGPPNYVEPLHLLQEFYHNVRRVYFGRNDLACGNDVIAFEAVSHHIMSPFCVDGQ